MRCPETKQIHSRPETRIRRTFHLLPRLFIFFKKKNYYPPLSSFCCSQSLYLFLSRSSHLSLYAPQKLYLWFLMIVDKLLAELYVL